MFDPVYLSAFITIPVLGIFLSSIFTIFIQNKKFLIIEQLGSVLIFLTNIILIVIIALGFGIGADVPSPISDFLSINLTSLLILILVQLVFFFISMFSLKYLCYQIIYLYYSFVGN